MDFCHELAGIAARFFTAAKVWDGWYEAAAWALPAKGRRLRASMTMIGSRNSLRREIRVEIATAPGEK
ncbi:hypothetical protein Kisp02_12580 [Kineosporia sp. NBRC 101731]|nr:hypothetical protein Kisp02_12580 [Kineosporia sp. NBRC 101731]